MSVSIKNSLSVENSCLFAVISNALADAERVKAGRTGE
jgi:hypothetical protein